LHILSTLPLEQLTLSARSVTNSGFKLLAHKQIRYLQLCVPTITDEVLPVLSTLPLETLRLLGTKISKQGRQQLLEKCQKDGIKILIT